MKTNIPEGYCQCGCGQRTKVPTRNDASKGWVKGVPMPYLRGHYNKAHGIPAYQKKFLSESRIGDKNPNWKNGIYFDRHHGRWMIRCRDGSSDQFAVAIARNKYGRFPTPGEVVHHLDGCKTNDCPENIIILPAEEHNRLHAKLNPISKTSESCYRGGLKGGQTTKNRYGSEYYKRISRLGVEARRRKRRTPNGADSSL